VRPERHHGGRNKKKKRKGWEVSMHNLKSSSAHALNGAGGAVVRPRRPWPVGGSLLVTSACLASLLGVPPARAQQAPVQQTPAQQAPVQGATVGEIIVTARKRQESILNVPVVETAIPQQRLERFQVRDMRDIATLVPGLAFGNNVLSIGTQISLRGVGTSSSDPGVDQSVSLNIDGLQLTNGLAFASGAFDLGQVEVLKGPQALFYGKASPGGVISLRSADPTDKFEVIARAGYEFEASEKRGEVIVSGPITDTLKGRLAAFYSDQDGFYNNIVAAPLPPLGGRIGSSRLPAETNWMIRGTLLWNPTSNFNARLKINNVNDKVTDEGVYQLAKCPDGTGPVLGIQFLNPGDNCHLDRNVSWVELDPAAFPFTLQGGTNFIDTTQTYGTLELNWAPRPDLTVTSTTGYYLLHSTSDYPASNASFAGDGIEATNGFRRRETTEELRVNSDFAFPLNFTGGAFFERGRVSDEVGVFGNTFIGFPPFLTKGTNIIEIRTNSVFGQLRYKIIPQVELAAGARWTDETRTNTGTADFTGSGVQLPITRPVPQIGSNNISPEFSITYRPTDDLTVFGNLKQAYKSGSFSIATPPVPGLDNSFGEEKVQGGELGLKSRWLDRTLAFNVALYDYRYTGLQVGAITPIGAGGLPVVKTVNAGAAKSKGMDADITYVPPWVPHLSLTAAANYNQSRYDELNNVPCYGGQTIAEGCNLIFSPAANLGLGGFTAQNSAGLPLVRAPKWQANFGFEWETDIGHDLRLIVANSQQYSSRMLVDLGEPFYQGSFFKSDLSLTLQGPRDRWEFALIGKNLNNAITTGACVNSNMQGGGIPGTEITGSTLTGPAGHDEIGCIMDRGREIWLRVTLKPFG
jgi:iron complex outermembrane receptor protein